MDKENASLRKMIFWKWPFYSLELLRLEMHRSGDSNVSRPPPRSLCHLGPWKSLGFCRVWSGRPHVITCVCYHSWDYQAWESDFSEGSHNPVMGRLWLLHRLP